MCTFLAMYSIGHVLYFRQVSQKNCLQIVGFMTMQELGVQDAKDARARLFFDISFFIIITTIGLNIVFGIIIDTFSELRDARVCWTHACRSCCTELSYLLFIITQFHAEQDMKSNCFICGLPSHEFDKLGNNVMCLGIKAYIAIVWPGAIPVGGMAPGQTIIANVDHV